jgi:hypothetical protein
MKRSTISLGILLASLLVNHMSACGEETDVTVQRGKVKASTDTGTVTVAAGQKATLTQGKDPILTIDDPMVKDLLEINEWVEAEKKDGRTRIDYTSIQISSIENEHAWRHAHLGEIPNRDTKPSSTCRIGLTSILKEPKYYDAEGVLIPFDLEKKSESQGYYYLHFPKPVLAGEKFKYITVSGFQPPTRNVWKERKLWRIWLANNTPYCLNYFRLILPQSAILVDSSLPPVSID